MSSISYSTNDALGLFWVQKCVFPLRTALMAFEEEAVLGRELM
jgi:hypothetical protein